ncbi:MAG: DUF2029 domain-containing protein [Candidatus Omnitrophota bacterium]|jgi:hypothetical protein|nr:MAG: DUF2029 domain-containing protein [Candidatus Omnitrophota bacterium]
MKTEFTSYSSEHALSQLIFPQSTGMKILRGIVVFVLAGIGLFVTASQIQRVQEKQDYRKDFLAIYTLTNAVAHGADPTLPIDDLARMYVDEFEGAAFPHPTPHPPTMGVLFLPLAMFPYPTAKTIWLVSQFGCLFLSIRMFDRAGGKRSSIWRVGFITVILQAWYPVFIDVSNGQVNCMVLFLLTGCWLALRSRRSWTAGVLLGLSLLVKQIAWPVLILFLFKKDLRACLATTLTIFFGYIIAGVMVGFGRLYSYFTTILPAIANLYQANPWNLSLWTLGKRMFEGTGVDPETGATFEIVTQPFFPSVVMSTIVFYFIPILCLILAAALIWKFLDSDWSFALLLCCSIILNPLSWPHYFVLALFPLFLIIRRLRENRFPPFETNLSIIIIMFLLPNIFVWKKLAAWAAGGFSATNGILTLPFAPGLLLLGPTFALCALSGLLVYYQIQSKNLQRNERVES